MAVMDGAACAVILGIIFVYCCVADVILFSVSLNISAFSTFIGLVYSVGIRSDLSNAQANALSLT